MNPAETVCFTGHRALPAQDRKILEQKTEQIIEPLIQLGYKNFLCGGAIGFDMLAGFAVLKWKQRYPSIKLILFLPCRDQDALWTSQQKSAYQRLLSQADEIHYISEKYNSSCMLRRNRCMVEQSTRCIAYLTRSYGGTAYTVRLAERTGKTVHNLGAIPLPSS